MVLPFQVALFSGVSVAALMASSSLSAYAVGSNEPEFVADFSGSLNSGTEYYRSGGADTTFSSVFTHSGLVAPATMTDSDGDLKWAPHNLVLNSASPATQSITVVSGADYTVEITGSGSVALSGAGSGTVTAGNPVEITASTSSLTLTVTGSPTTMWAYRSDLGGMVNNPDTSSTYVATTGSAKFLPRRNHYLFNGSTYDNAGILIESAAATNLATYSNDFTNVAWSKVNCGTILQNAVGPDGQTSAYTIVDDNGGGTANVAVAQAFIVATSTTYTASVFAKQGTLGGIVMYTQSFTTPANVGYYFDLTNGTVSSAFSGGTGLTPRIESVGGGWYRCSITFTTDASDTTGSWQVYLADVSGTPTVDITVDGTKTVLLYGAQFEAGSVPTSYIPVVAGSTVTRAAETLTVAGANLPYSATAMSFHVKSKLTYVDNDIFIGVYDAFSWQNTGINYIAQRLDVSSTRQGRPYLDLREPTTTRYTNEFPTDALTPGVNKTFNVASRVVSGGSATINQASGGTLDTAAGGSSVMPSVSATNLAIGVGLNKASVSVTSLFRMWGTDIGDSGIETAST